MKNTTIESYNNTVDDYIKHTDRLHPTKDSKKFLSHIKKNSLILDLGCGPGRDAKIFIKKGFRVVGIDLSEKMIQAASKRVKGAEFHVMDIRKLKFKDYVFDGVWASASFLHLPKKDMELGLKEAYRVLKIGGIFYISVRKGRGEFIKPDKRYKRTKKFWSLFQRKEIEELLNKVGFTIIESFTEKKENSYNISPYIQVFCKK